MAEAAPSIGEAQAMKVSWIALVGGAVLIVDQVSKWVAAQAGLVQLNTGVSFGLLPQSNAVGTVLILLAISSALFIGKQHWVQLPVATGLFWGGAASNVLDRLLFGAVRDWMPVPAASLTNNVADWAIALGALLFVWRVLFMQKEARAKA